MIQIQILRYVQLYCSNRYVTQTVNLVKGELSIIIKGECGEVFLITQDVDKERHRQMTELIILC